MTVRELIAALEAGYDLDVDVYIEIRRDDLTDYVRIEGISDHVVDYMGPVTVPLIHADREED